MSIESKIITDLKTAIKEGDKEKLSVLRMLKSAILNKKIENKKSKEEELKDEKVVEVIKSEIKKRKDSIDSYTQGGRMELAEAEKKEISVLENYKPEEMSEDSIKKIVSETADEINVSGQSDFGKLMGAVMSKVNGQADGQLVSRLVKEKLSND